MTYDDKEQSNAVAITRESLLFNMNSVLELINSGNDIICIEYENNAKYELYDNICCKHVSPINYSLFRRLISKDDFCDIYDYPINEPEFIVASARWYQIHTNLSKQGFNVMFNKVTKNEFHPYVNIINGQCYNICI